MFLQLGALREQVAQLNPHVPAFVDNGGVLASLAAEGDGSSWWAQWLERLSHYFRIDFSAAQDIRPVLSGQSLAQVRLALTLALQQAQGVLDEQFNQDNPAVQALRARLGELVTQPVSVGMPDLTAAMAALQAYVQLRESGPAPTEALPDAIVEDPQP